MLIRHLMMLVASDPTDLLKKDRPADAGRSSVWAGEECLVSAIDSLLREITNEHAGCGH